MSLNQALLPNTFVEDIRFDGAERRIFVYEPGGAPPTAGWPLLCMTDGNAVFATAVDAVRAQSSWPSGTDVEDGVVVAIGYPTSQPYDPLRRAWDLSPPPGRTYPATEKGGVTPRTGGGLEMLQFLAEELLPWIAARVPVDARRRSLFGHSFGGVFALLTLYARPSLFRCYCAASPSLFGEDEALRPFEEAFFSQPPELTDVRVHLSAGEYEGSTLAPFYLGRADEVQRRAQQSKARTVIMAEALAERFNALGRRDVRASFELFKGENHLSALPVAINRAIQAAFAVSWQIGPEPLPKSPRVA